MVAEIEKLAHSVKDKMRMSVRSAVNSDVNPFGAVLLRDRYYDFYRQNRSGLDSRSGFLLVWVEDLKAQDCYNQVEVFTAKHNLE